MKLAAVAVLVLASIVPARGSACGAAVPISVEEYRAELQRLKQATAQVHEVADLVDLMASTPPECAVSFYGNPVTVSFEWMRSAIHDAQQHSERMRASLDRIATTLSAMEEQAEASVPASPPASVRAHLGEILSRREFAQVQQQSWLDVWRQRVLLALIALLDWIFSRVHVSKGASDLLMWAVIAALFAMLVWLVVRSIARGRRPQPLPEAAPVRRNVTDWLQLAAEAARRGAYRDAVHHGYWAAVARLEDGGAWRPDRARTPREYLRVLPRAHSGWQPFSVLTQRFERAWYGSRPVTQPEFSEVVAELERLGCRLS